MFTKVPAILSVIVMTACLTSFTFAQETAKAIPDSTAPAMSEPGSEHKWLQQFEGEWTTTMNPVGPAAGNADSQEEPNGKMSSKMLGGFWMVNNFELDMGGTTMHAIQTIGYDTEKKKYIGTWVDSMMNHMWHYEGVVEASGKKILLEADGPNIMGGEGMARFRDSYEFKSADHIILTSETLSEGKWTTFMTMDIRRKK